MENNLKIDLWVSNDVHLMNENEPDQKISELINKIGLVTEQQEGNKLDPKNIMKRRRGLEIIPWRQLM